MEIKNKINTFIFDCFGVVCSTPLFSWYKENMTDRGLADEKLLEVFKDYDLNKLSGEDVAHYFSKYEGITSSKEKIVEQIDSYLKINTELIKIIKQLKNNRYKIALLSNGNTAYFESRIYLKYPEFKKLFDEIIISSDVGIVKPDKEIYLYALQKINSKPEESLFIDDSQINVDGAKNVGIQGFLYTDSDSFTEYIKKLGINLCYNLKMEKPRKTEKSKDGKEMHYSVGILLEHNGKYLLMDRINPPLGFACPAGHIDEGEEPKISAIRELKEETGITVQDLEFVCEEEIPWNYCESASVHYWYLYKISTGEEKVIIEKDEAKSIGWYTPLEIKEMNIEKVWLYWFKKLKII